MYRDINVNTGTGRGASAKTNFNLNADTVKESNSHQVATNGSLVIWATLSGNHLEIEIEKLKLNRAPPNQYFFLKLN